MRKELPTKKRQEMFRVWTSCKDDHEVARTCHVGVSTVRKYKRVDDWKEQEEKLLKKMRARFGDRMAYSLARDLLRLDYILDHLGKELYDKMMRGELQGSVKDFIDLLKLKDQVLDKVDPGLPEEQEDAAEIEVLLKVVEEKGKMPLLVKLALKALTTSASETTK